VEEKFQLGFKKESDLKKKLKEAQDQAQVQEKELKGHLRRIKDYQAQVVQYQQENSKLLCDKQRLEDDAKKSASSYKEDLAKLQLANAKLQQEKQKLEEQLRVEMVATQQRIEGLREGLLQITKERDALASEKVKIDEENRQDN